MPLSASRLKAIFIVILLAPLALAGCKSARHKDLQSSPEVLYKQAKSSLNNGDYTKAISSYESLEARFPFSDSARQGRLDLMYAYYKSRQPEQAVDTADQFIRENPTHPRVDYAHFIKGMVYFENVPGRLGRWLSTDLSKRPPSDALKSFAAFKTLVEQFPRSDYAHDARRRMIYLRNRLAAYEVSVAQYYVLRGAYVGALARAKYVIETYDGAPQVKDALALMTTCYKELKMPELAQQTEQVYKENFGTGEMQKIKTKPWYRFW